MRVILLKDCKDGKANTVIDVAAGYGNNFLIARGLAVAYNEKTKKELDSRLSELTQNEIEKRQEALELKEKIAQEKLIFTLDGHIDANGNLNVNKTVSTKDINKELAQLGYKLDKYAVQKVRLVSNGKHEIEINLYKDIKAILHVEVNINVK